MTLVDYSSSDSEDHHERESQHRPTAGPAGVSVQSSTLKRKRSNIQPSDAKQSLHAKDELPPLPSSFHDLYASAARASTQDDPSLHGGRKRSIPHAEGNWPSHVYLEWYPSPKELNLLSNVVTLVEPQSQVQSLLQSDLGTPRPLHISLSQSLNLGTEQRQHFLSKLISLIRAPSSSAKYPLRGPKNLDAPGPENQHVSPFTTRFSSLHWFPNYSNDRWFLVLRVEKPANDELHRLLQVCNNVARGFGQNELYSEKGSEQDKRTKNTRDELENSNRNELGHVDDCFHISVAWSLERPSVALPSSQSISGPLNTGVELQKALTQVKELELHFDSVKVKIGNATQSLRLSEKLEDKSQGILG